MSSFDELHAHVHSDGTIHDEHGNHVHPDGTVSEGYEHYHVHPHGAGHGHNHVHANKKAVLGRLARSKGHLESVIRMVEDNRDCAEVLVQLAAVRSAINNVGKVILQDHIKECISEAVVNDDQEMIDELNRAIAQFMK